MGTTTKGHYAIRTQLGKIIRADYHSGPSSGSPDWADENNYWIIWISANRSFTAGTYYRLYADGRFEHWHLYEDGTEQKLGGTSD